MASHKNMYWFGCTLVLVLSIALVADAQTFFQNGRFGKRADARLRVASRSADERFYGGPRFGRSGNGIAPTIINDMDSRGAERFFIGSRYGKRSELEQIVPGESGETDPSNTHVDKEALLECISIGIEKLYHCERKSGPIKEEP